MKKLIFAILCGCAMAFSACSNNDNDITPATPTIAADSDKPATEIFVQGQRLEEAAQTKAAAGQSRVNVATGQTYDWPYVNTEEGWAVAFFSIRADGNIPGYIDQSPALYYGRPAFKQGKNRGRVSLIYPYGNYNDRDYDYTQVDKKTGQNIGLFRYVYDREGQKTQLAILEQPSVKGILEDNVDELTAAINKGQNVTNNQNQLDKINDLLALGEEYLNKHVLWYVVKEVGAKSYWHVDGVITDHEVADARAEAFKVADEVEVDIHQQIHQDWNEIKTSVHVRSACGSVKINIPLAYEDIVEQDDFAIRVYNFYYKEYEVTPTITHNAQGITIEINNIPDDLIKELKDNYGDGLTVEIHSYCTREDIWEQLKESKVTKLGKPCTVKGQITTAYDADRKQPIYAPKN